MKGNFHVPFLEGWGPVTASGYSAKGTESDHNGWDYIMGNGQMIPGLQMAPKVFTIIYDVELGKPYVLPIFWVGTP
jgi:hypothetical protein